MKLKDLDKDYKKKQLAWKTHIRMKSTKWKRFWAWVWYFLTFAFVWLFYNIRDWRSAICVFISLMLWSSSVWIWYALAIFTGVNTNTAKWFAGIGTAVWIWWASPVGSPFILLVTFTAIGLKGILNKIREKKSRKNKTAKNEIINNKNAENLQKNDIKS